MAGFGEYSGYNRPFSFDRPINNEQDFYDVRYQQMYGYQTPLHEEYQGPPLVIDESPDDESSAFVTTGINVATLITENLLSHPFIVLRRQCQVHNTMKNYHIVPYTLLPVIVKLHRRQELTTLWKGIGSTCVVRGVTLALEDLISKFTPWPKDINKCKSILQFFQHILLKCVSFAIITPFYSASFVETVQSDIASDKPGLFDVFKEGGVRLLEWGCPRKGRMLPIWAIVLPTVGFGVSKYLFQLIMRGITSRMLRFQQRHRYEINDSFPRAGHNPIIEDIEMKANLFAFVSTEVAFYPIETIIHRLHIQGTRTIIDNLDTGTSVQPILTGYEGFFDCYNSTLAKEGPGGFYKGFGSLVFQLCAHFAIIKLSTWIVSEISYLLRPASKPVSKSHSEVSLYSQQKYLIN